MGRLYMETNALYKIINYTKEDNVYTSVFALFELVSGINSAADFNKRKVPIKRIIKRGIPVDWEYVDKKLSNFFGRDLYDKNFSNTFKHILSWLMKDDYFSFKTRKIRLQHKSGLIFEENVLDWLREKDKRISDIRSNCEAMFDEDKDFIREKYRTEGIKGLADYCWSKYKDEMIDDNRLSHAEAFCGKEEADKVRQAINDVFSDYTFRLFMTAQAIIFIKAVYIDGGAQDRNNPSDLLHLLYLNEGDRIISNDNIFDRISDGIDYFQPIKISTEKSIDEIRKKNQC